jgi:hypothetical protein
MKLTKLLISVIILIIVTNGCFFHHHSASSVKPIVWGQNIHYHKDIRTGLCFAVLNMTAYTAMYSITCVPCDSVRKLLEK